jgi:hypothetical protein
MTEAGRSFAPATIATCGRSRARLTCRARARRTLPLPYKRADCAPPCSCSCSCLAGESSAHARPHLPPHSVSCTWGQLFGDRGEVCLRSSGGSSWSDGRSVPHCLQPRRGSWTTTDTARFHAAGTMVVEHAVPPADLNVAADETGRGPSSGCPTTTPTRSPPPSARRSLLRGRRPPAIRATAPRRRRHRHSCRPDDASRRPRCRTGPGSPVPPPVCSRVRCATGVG